MRVTIAAVVTAIALFFFGWLWWGVTMGVVKPYKTVESEAAILELDKDLSEPGLYHHGNSEMAADYDGSTFFLYYTPGEPTMFPMLALGLANMFICAVLASVLVATVNYKSFLARFGMVFFLGLFVAVWADLGNNIWWWHPMDWTIVHFLYDIISWAIAGGIIAAIVTPESMADPEAK